ncbi:ABC transporter ATP-binding protein [Microbacterium soli]|uniref:ABC transporter ATP-binding protein n=1 Tax=Microbacterium soli TaxID=446075 RepID=A0ABP7N321_9MICO
MSDPAGLDLFRLRFSRAGRMIVDGVDITASRGEVTALLGANGAGKSTLLRLVVGALQADAGDIGFDGRALSAMRRRERAQRVALVEQEWVAAEGLAGRDVVALGRVPHQGWFAADADDDAVIDASLARAGALPFAAQDAATLSGGERQRINLARALAQQPSLLLCDEPTNHLDIRAQLDTLALLRGLARDGMAIMAALHDLNHAAAHADRVVVLADRRVRASGTPAEVLTPALISAVWGVDADVLAHPRTGRPLIVFGSRTGSPS